MSNSSNRSLPLRATPREGERQKRDTRGVWKDCGGKINSVNELGKWGGFIIFAQGTSRSSASYLLVEVGLLLRTIGPRHLRPSPTCISPCRHHWPRTMPTPTSPCLWLITSGRRIAFRKEKSGRLLGLRLTRHTVPRRRWWLRKNHVRGRMQRKLVGICMLYV